MKYEYKWSPFGERVPPNYAGTKFIVIGNIHQNPKLLEVNNDS